MSNKEGQNDLRLTYVEEIEVNGQGGFPKDVTITYYKNNDSSDPNNRATLVIENMNEKDFNDLQKNRIVLSNKEGNLVDKTGTEIKTPQITSTNFSSLTLSTGELGGLQKSHNELDSFINQLNQLTKSIVFSVNAVHSGKTDATADTLPFFVSSEGGDENSITAGNISINKTLLDDPMKLKVRKNDHMFDDGTQNSIDGQGDGDRALAIASLRDKLFNISDIGKTINSREDFFNPNKGGSELVNNGLDITNAKSGVKIESQYKNMVTTVGIRAQESAREADNFEDLVYNLEISRMSVSGVSLDEEMSSLITFQHAYNASARVISTVDKLLDVIINGLM